MSNAPKRKALGRGLAALIPEPEAAADSRGGAEVPTTALDPNPFQPRSAIDPGRLAELTAAVPLGRVATPDEIAGVEPFLASPDADVFVVDLRSEQAFSQATHMVAGASRIPPGDFERHIDRLPQDKEIILYCT